MENSSAKKNDNEIVDDVERRLRRLEVSLLDWVRPDDFCQYFGIKKGSFYQLCHKGILKRKGRHFSISAYEKYLDENRKRKLLAKRAKSIQTA